MMEDTTRESTGGAERRGGESIGLWMGGSLKESGGMVNSMEKESYDLRRGKCWLKESGRMDSKFIEH